MASINDLFNRASNGTAPVATTLAAQKAVAAASLSLSASTGWPTATAVHFKLYRVATANAIVAGTETIWKGTLSGTTVSNLTLKSGTDQIYAAGSIAEVMPTSAWADDLFAGLTAEHNQLDGKHAAVTATSLVTTGAVTSGGLLTASNGLTLSSGTLTLPNNAITGAALATSAITLGYAEVTADQGSITTIADLTSLTVTVTVPVGGRRIKITGYVRSTNTTVDAYNFAYIFEGSTQLQAASANSRSGSAAETHNILYSTVASSGSHTYKLRADNGGSGTMTMRASATAPSFILVEAI